jgi:carbon-monoxide dehydrogenase medium subunit
VKLPQFELHRPGSSEEASRLLVELGDDASAYSGGTELLLAMKLGLIKSRHLVDLKPLPELKGIELRPGGLWIGAGATHREIETSSAVRAILPPLARMAARIANVRVRAVGTIGGNLCFADPNSDPATFLTAVGARLRARVNGEMVEFDPEEFTEGPYQTVLGTGDLLLGVWIPAPPPGSATVHLRMKIHERPSVTVAAQVEVSSGEVLAARLAVGSVGPKVLRVELGEELRGLSGAGFSARVRSLVGLLAGSIPLLPERPESPEYLRHLVRLLASRALEAGLEGARS